MKAQFGKLIFWTIALYIFMSPVRDLLIGSTHSQNLISRYFTNPRFAIMNWNFILICIGFAILGYTSFLKFYPQKKYTHIFLLIFVGSVAIVSYRYLVEEVILFNLFDEGNFPEGTSFQVIFFDSLYYMILFSFLGVVLFFIQSTIESEKRIKELKNSELSFLKSQINPHFLFNNLNNIYSMVNAKSDHALDSISKLSQMLRYSLYENDKLINVSKEWKYIEDYLILESYRQKKELAIKMNFDKSIQEIQIAPFVLIPFIENAIKHGTTTDSNHPIEIELLKEGKDLYYSCLLYTSPSPRDQRGSRMPSSA